MEQFLNYYNFSSFFKDQSSFFDTIAYCWIKDDLFLILEKKDETYNVHFTSYESEKNIGKQKPNALNTLIENFKLDDNDHRKVIQNYLDYN